MMFRCISKFDTEGEDETEENDLTLEEKQRRDEIREAQLQEFAPDPISDDEESDDREERNQAKERPSDITEVVQVQLVIPSGPSQHALGKRRRTETDEASADDETLPETHQKVSRRARVRPERKDDGYDYY
jgi:hypothetical protein